MAYQDARARLAGRIAPEILEEGIEALERVHLRTRCLVEGRATEPLSVEHHGYAGYYIHLLTPALHAIAADGWVERHLQDYIRLAASPTLPVCCRATVIELFGVQAFHVAIQHYPLSDGLVQGLCHGHWDKIQTVRRIAGQLVHLRSTHGTYPPLIDHPREGVSMDGPVFDAIAMR